MRLPGVASLEAKLDEQNRLTEQHREFEGQALRALETKADTIQALAERTNGRVNGHDIQLAVIAKAEEQALIVEAARTKASADRQATSLSWRQLAVSAVAGAVLLLIVSIIVFWITNSGVH